MQELSQGMFKTNPMVYVNNKKLVRVYSSLFNIVQGSNLDWLTKKSPSKDSANSVARIHSRSVFWWPMVHFLCEKLITHCFE